jgi:hypothetical protein
MAVGHCSAVETSPTGHANRPCKKDGGREKMQFRWCLSLMHMYDDNFITFTLLFSFCSLLRTVACGPACSHLHLHSQMHYTVRDETMQNYYAFSTYHANSQMHSQNGSHRLGSALTNMENTDYAKWDPYGASTFGLRSRFEVLGQTSRRRVNFNSLNMQVCYIISCHVIFLY